MAAFLQFSRRAINPALISHKLLLAKPHPIIGVSAAYLDKRSLTVSPTRYSTTQTVNVEKKHAAHWVAERAVAMALFAVIPAAYIMPPSFAMDTALTASLVLHAHWGINGVFGDYMHGYPGKSGERKHPILNTVAKVLPLVLSVTAFACLTSFNYNDVGLVKAIAMLWRV